MKKYISIFFIIILFGCTKEDTSFHTGGLSVPEINGYITRDNHGHEMQTIGNPNVKLGSGTEIDKSAYYFVCYPNPANDIISFYVKTPTPDIPKQLWITHANYSGQENSNINLGINNIQTSGAIFQTEFTRSNVSIYLSDYPSGYYRVYLKINEYIFYDNIVIYSNGSLSF